MRYNRLGLDNLGSYSCINKLIHPFHCIYKLMSEMICERVSSFICSVTPYLLRQIARQSCLLKDSFNNWINIKYDSCRAFIPISIICLTVLHNYV